MLFVVCCIFIVKYILFGVDFHKFSSNFINFLVILLGREMVYRGSVQSDHVS